MNMNWSYWMGLANQSKYELSHQDKLSERISKREYLEYTDLMKRNRECTMTEKKAKIRIHKFRLFARQYTILIEKRA